VVFDMDETLLSAICSHENYYDMYGPPEFMEPNVVLNMNYKAQRSQVKVVFRPFMRESLEFLNEKFNLVIYTAGT
jgi:hypothetical protein